MKKINIVAFGASVIEGIIELKNPEEKWTDILKEKLGNAFPDTQFNVVNSGVGGQSIMEAISRYDEDVKSHFPDYVILGFGGNNEDPLNEKRRVSGEEYRNCLDALKKRLEPCARIVIMVMPPVIDEQHWACKHPYILEKGGMDKVLERDRKVSREFAWENNYSIVDLSLKLRELMKKSPKNYYTLPDGVHLTKEGYKVLTDMMFDVLYNLIHCSIKLNGDDDSNPSVKCLQ